VPLSLGQLQLPNLMLPARTGPLMMTTPFRSM